MLQVFHRDPGTGQFEADVIQIPLRPKSQILPMMGSKRLGAEEGGSLTLPLIIGAAGLGSVYLSKTIEDQDESGNSNQNMKMAMKFLGFGAIGWSLYSVISSFGSSEKADAEAPSAIPGAAEFATVSGSFLTPVGGSQVANSAGGVFKDGYDAELVFSNPAFKPVDLMYQIVATERPTYLFGMDAGWWTPNIAQVASGVITVPAKKSQSLPLKLKPVSNLSWMADGISVRLELQARRTAGDPWKVLSKVDFTYDRAGWL